MWVRGSRVSWKETVPPSYGRTPWPKPPAWRMRARYHRCPQSQSAPASRSATRIGLGLRAVRDEAELSEHEKSVPIPAKVLDLAISRDAHEPVRCQRLEAVEIVGVERVEQSLGDLSAVLTVHRGIATRGLIEGTKGKRLVRSSVQTLGRSCVG